MQGRDDNQDMTDGAIRLYVDGREVQDVADLRVASLLRRQVRERGIVAQRKGRPPLTFQDFKLTHPLTREVLGSVAGTGTGVGSPSHPARMNLPVLARVVCPFEDSCSWEGAIFHCVAW